MSTASRALALLSSAASALKTRRDDVNKLNVFPVPDGDTGTNMSLTIDAVVGELAALPEDADACGVCHAITHASLMGARGNSGVILSQILRGLCEVGGEAASMSTDTVAVALERAVVVAFQAVRKPVEGTMLTVLRDSSEAARSAATSGLDLTAALDHICEAAFDSVRRTPELLPVLKENGVVDAGGFGLAILAEGFAAAAGGHAVTVASFEPAPPERVTVVPENDWDDEEYLYCTEFLLFGEDVDREAVLDYVGGVGGSELVVGGGGELKIHVHTDDPGTVLSHMTSLGEVAQVHVNNMRRQTAARSAALREDARAASSDTEITAAQERKSIGVATVAVGEGLKRILTSLGADVIVNGGQTMNPSTAELLDAVTRVNADSVVILPNNRNILLAAQQVIGVADRPVAVVPTDSVPQAFAALLAYDRSMTLEDAAEAMTAAACAVRTGEVTTAVKDASSKSGPIKTGQVIGIADDEIEVVGSDVMDVSLRLAELISRGAETLTVLAGEDLDDAGLEALAGSLSAAHPELEVETHRGDQPLYPVIMAAE
jgi:DAK2 domain fusion protein YloV